MSSTTNILSHFVSSRRQNKRMPSIGTRELEILEVLWNNQSQSLSVVAVQQQLSSGQPQSAIKSESCISVNTVQSTLERLVKKQLLARSKTGRAFYYKAIVPKQEVITGLIRDIAKDMSSGDSSIMVSGFMDFLTSEDPALSEKLSKALDNNRK
jgi:predicted transcriptional regulator